MQQWICDSESSWMIRTSSKNISIEWKSSWKIEISMSKWSFLIFHCLYVFLEILLVRIRFRRKWSSIWLENTMYEKSRSNFHLFRWTRTFLVGLSWILMALSLRNEIDLHSIGPESLRTVLITILFTLSNSSHSEDMKWYSYLEDLKNAEKTLKYGSWNTSIYQRIDSSWEKLTTKEKTPMWNMIFSRISRNHIIFAMW